MKKTIFISALFAANMTAGAQQMTDTDTHSQYIQQVVEFKPAPGQFVNIYPTYEEGDTYDTMLSKCTALLQGSDGGRLVSLGGFGGYVTFRFDHSIANVAGSADVAIMGNAFSGNSEPGIVMVSKDVNGNGLPDDPWYELRGSADDDGTAVYHYTITYQRPLTEEYDTEKSTISRYITIEKYIPWTDSQGNSGYVHKNMSHSQPYFPCWLTGDELTFTGTLLPKNAVNSATPPAESWLLSSFEWGYVDNKANTELEACSFNFDMAVDENRQPVAIDFVDFIRVYCAENQDCGWIGETSTEVSYAYDLHLEESLAAIREATAGISGVAGDKAVPVAYYTLDGKQVKSPQRGLHLARMSNGQVLKIRVQ